jgi:hypothetical protein
MNADLPALLRAEPNSGPKLAPKHSPNLSLDQPGSVFCGRDRAHAWIDLLDHTLAN